MPIQTQYMHYDMWTYFFTTPPMSTDQVSIIITNFPRIFINARISLWCEICLNNALSLIHAEQIIKSVTLHLESEFKEIKFPKMDHFAIPNFPHSNMSKWGLIFHR